MGLDDAYIKAVASVTQLDPRTVASASGVEYRKNRFVIPLFSRIYTMQIPDFKILELGTDARVPKLIEVLLMHYLSHADGTALSGSWISYRQLPGAKLFEQRFKNLVARPMIEAFDGNLNSFRDAAYSLGGQSLDITGDAAFSFQALPRLPIACIFNNGEEEIPSYVNVLFDGSAPHYLPTEDLAILGGLMNNLMKKCIKTN